jgi:lysophospholipase L1-like esterase
LLNFLIKTSIFVVEYPDVFMRQENNMMTENIAFESGRLILFIGDSITDTQRRETPYAPLGQGYVHFTANLLAARYPRLNLTFENRGISGDTTRALKKRWQQDCLQLNPGVVSIMIGINDLWRRFAEAPEMQQAHVPPDEYRANLHWMLSQVKEHGCSRIILMEPFYFCANPTDPMYLELDRYLRVVRELAGEFDALLVPIQQAYEALKNDVPEERWSRDRVHPYTWAHAWIARQWLLAVTAKNC